MIRTNENRILIYNLIVMMILIEELLDRNEYLLRDKINEE